MVSAITALTEAIFKSLINRIYKIAEDAEKHFSNIGNSKELESFFFFFEISILEFKLNRNV